MKWFLLRQRKIKDSQLGTAAQNKAENGEAVDSVGELIALCEKQGYIERFYTDQPNDKVDIAIKDMQRYTRRLVEEETNLNELLEAAVDRNAKEDAEAVDEDIVDFDEDDSTLVDDDDDAVITDDDFTSLMDFQEKEFEKDQELFKQ